jgi:hypothetical protein
MSGETTRGNDGDQCRRDRSVTDPYLRPGNILHSFSRLYPDAWKQVDEFRASRKELGDWADWCFLPLA